jgi:osmotically-inducible protein OsmY
LRSRSATGQSRFAAQSATSGSATPPRRSPREVRGVRHVEDELTVDLRDRWDDEQLRGAALQALIDDDDVPADRIDATVSSAWLTLSGEVKHQSQSNAAFEAVAGLPGVGGITNKIRVVAAAGR